MLLTTSLAGCSSGLSTGDVEIRSDQRAYFPPVTARVTVRNDWHNTLYLAATLGQPRPD